MRPAEAYILRQPQPYREILLELQAFVEQKLPAVSLEFRYRIPFYYLSEKPFCYLNQSGDYVDLGFYRGYLLTRHPDKMESRGRKMVASLRYRHLGEIDFRVLEEVLEEAVELQNKPFTSGD
mgnify:CR=1 FL=1